MTSVYTQGLRTYKAIADREEAAHRARLLADACQAQRTLDTTTADTTAGRIARAAAQDALDALAQASATWGAA